MKLFVDDFRECPEGWTLARTVTEAIRLIHTHQPEEISLDHDIRVCANKRCANRGETFEPVARFLAAYGYNPRRVIFHTGNCGAAYKMAEMLGVHYDPSQIFNKENYPSERP